MGKIILYVLGLFGIFSGNTVAIILGILLVLMALEVI